MRDRERRQPRAPSELWAEVAKFACFQKNSRQFLSAVLYSSRKVNGMVGVSLEVRSLFKIWVYLKTVCKKEADFGQIEDENMAYASTPGDFTKKKETRVNYLLTVSENTQFFVLRMRTFWCLETRTSSALNFFTFLFSSPSACLPSCSRPSSLAANNLEGKRKVFPFLFVFGSHRR